MKYARILLSSLLGNTLEYYEFTIFAIFAIQIGKTFFPEYAPETQILLAFSIFGTGFIARPLGSAVFGHIGDKMGRKIALILTILGMSIVTIGIGLMPSYKYIGIFAPILLSLFRLLQGLFLGGEGVGAAVYILEHELENTFHLRRGIVGGLLITANVTGTLIAGIVGLVINTTIGLDTESWRLAFIIGGICGLAIGFLRLGLPETERFNKTPKENKPRIPLLYMIRNHFKEAILVITFAGFTASISYINKGYLATYFQAVMEFSTNMSFICVAYVSGLVAILSPIFGYFSDKYTYRKFNRVIIGTVMILYLPAFMLITRHNYICVLAGLTMMAILTSAILTPTYVFLSDLFPPEVRYSGVGVNFNLGVTIFGGFTPSISIYLTHLTDLNYAPAFYVFSLAVIYVILRIVLRILNKTN
ncbi:MAG: MFS transporter [Rickettsiales bacterium]|nr:MFS transporter [Rickettsiales bacterium]